MLTNTHRVSIDCVVELLEEFDASTVDTLNPEHYDDFKMQIDQWNRNCTNITKRINRILELNANDHSQIDAINSEFGAKSFQTVHAKDTPALLQRFDDFMRQWEAYRASM